MKDLKQRLLNYDFVEFQDLNDNQFTIWFNPKSNNFCLEMNCKVIKSTKTFKPIHDKLFSFGELEELQ